jgi:hypothetical protein
MRWSREMDDSGIILRLHQTTQKGAQMIALLFVFKQVYQLYQEKLSSLTLGWCL